MNQSLFSVITTIQSPTPAVVSLASRLLANDARLLIVGDKKGPVVFDLPGTEFLGLKHQLETSFELARKLPTGHYARKNVGYLMAISQGAGCIYETDDDNAPLPSWTPRQMNVEVREVHTGGWVNVYRLFTEGKIWPRGFPLDEVMASFSGVIDVADGSISVNSPIQQGLANNSPDVDAVWRLVLDTPFNFEPRSSVYLGSGTWCPFNSQSTWWWPVAYPLLYLPSYCSFRMTDIWRSFIAQRCLWQLRTGIVFHGPEVIQDRNEHNLMRDFTDEVPGYTHNRQIVDVLEGLALEEGDHAVGDNLLKCYEVLVSGGFFPAQELTLVRAWLHDLGIAGEAATA